MAEIVQTEALLVR